MKNLLILLFIVKVTIPMGIKETYQAKKIDWMMSNHETYCLILEDGRRVFVPRQWTVIEETK